MSELNAVDMSKWGGAFTDAEASCMKTQGIKLVIAGTGHPRSLGKWSEQHAGTAVRNGLVLDGYRWLNLSEPVRPQMENAFESMGRYLDDVRMWWPDAEDTTNPGNPQEVVEKLHVAVDFIETQGLRAGMYTGGWWWIPRTNNSDAFSHLPLWNADYRNAEKSLPYGGWSESAIWQYQGTTDLCGQSVDLNYAKNLRPPETDDLEELVLLIASVVGGRPDGVPFETVDEALTRFRTLELEDQRVLMGLGLTQELIATHIDTPTLLGGAHND